MGLSVIQGDVRVVGTLSPQSLNPPAGSIGNAAVQASAGIEATKVVHQFPLRYADDGQVTAITVPLHIARAAATLVAVEAIVTTAPGAGDSVSIDVQKGNQSTAFASVLAATLTIDENDAARQVKPATITTTAVADGDTLQLVVTVTGTTAQGLCVVVTLREDPEP